MMTGALPSAKCVSVGGWVTGFGKLRIIHMLPSPLDVSLAPSKHHRVVNHSGVFVRNYLHLFINKASLSVQRQVVFGRSAAFL